MAADPSELEKRIGYRFTDRELLVTALTHPSAVAEKGGGGNERMEFVGDAVIDLAVANILYRRHPNRAEGWLTQMRSRLVDEECLASKAREIGLGDFIILGKGEEKAGGRDKPSILAGTYESLLGAVFIDAGYDACDGIVERLFGEIETLAEDINPKDYKSLLQERLQKEGRDLPRYEITGVSGPDHERVFSVSVFIDDREHGSGHGRSKKEAEQQAARDALEK